MARSSDLSARLKLIYDAVKEARDGLTQEQDAQLYDALDDAFMSEWSDEIVSSRDGPDDDDESDDEDDDIFDD